MSVFAKLFIILTVLVLVFCLGTIDAAGVSKELTGAGLVGELVEHFRLEPREVYRVVPVLAAKKHVLGREAVLASSESEPVPQVKGLYVTAWKAGDSQYLDRLMTMMGQTGLNALVIDVKDDTGVIGYPTTVALAQTLGAGKRRYQPERLLERLRQERIYPIARIVVFKDPLLAARRRDLAVRDSRGRLWRDRRGMCWVDPYNKTVWEYNVALAQEAARLGFKEIQFDYVRFVSDGPIADCRYPGADGRAKSEVIRDFLKYAAEQLQGLGVKLAADVFGLTCSVQGELGIGQVFETVAAQVDVICPMVYPSHYAKGTYQLADPDANPYETVYRSLTDAQRKLAAHNRRPVIVRPWLQDFSLRTVYTRAQLEAQVKAVYDAGLTEWLFWNPWNNYEFDKYRFNVE